MSSQLFNDDIMSKSYLCRPDYSKEIVNEIIKFWQQFNFNFDAKNNLDIIDVACGSGQLSMKLLPYTRNLLGIDTSKSQIDHGKNLLKELSVENANFIVGNCESLPVKELSVDLITCAQAIHWFDVTKFYAEVDRCLKPGGVLAILTYGKGYVIGGVEPPVLEEMNKFVSKEFWFDDAYLGPYLTDHPKWAWKFLPDLRILYPVSGLRIDNMTFDVPYTLGGYGNYLQSTSMYRAWKKANPEKKDIIEYALERILGYFGRPHNDLDMALPMRFPLSIIMCAKPLVP